MTFTTHYTLYMFLNDNQGEVSWKLKDGEKETGDEQEIADTFNKFFVDNPEMKKDPLEKLRIKMDGENRIFVVFVSYD